MAFSNLSPQEKNAFFSLLDEYFTARPELVAQLGGKSNVNGHDAAPNQHAQAAAASAIHRAFSGNNSNANNNGPSPSPGFGRVAAASAAFAANRDQDTSTHARTPSGSLHKVTPAPAGLVQTRKFGSDVDTSSPVNLLSSLRHSTAAKHTPPPAVAPAPAPSFAHKKSAFPPPPSHAPVPAATPEPEPEPEPEQGNSGEWAEALYDYKSGEDGDLELSANQRVLVVDKTSEDWWTGEADGRRGLFPGSYVRLL
ncbi:hypothetical protein DENSPDRAFT_830628 [Dentipellis sp. KUC8613]|nr:hypothetical protein DENSPDRAFT_830628 [Dentipellis sp. KUC8613]